MPDGDRQPQSGVAASEGVSVRPANTAPPLRYPWPGSHGAAMFLSFDVDAEAAWTSKDFAQAERRVNMWFGGCEARVGVPVLLTRE